MSEKAAPGRRRARAAALVCSFAAVLAGCAAQRRWSASQSLHPITAAEVVVPGRNELPEIVGEMQHHRVVAGETLLDIARAAGLAFQELQDANPTVDEWVPKPGTDVNVPSRWILPRSHYRGLVINVAEMRLYMFPTRVAAGERVHLRTWPVGIGTQEAPSPVGSFTVTAKDENPTWIVPASIRRRKDETRTVVPPGPDNPLGQYRLRLSKGLYQIHGTDVPWSVGRLTTHGCIRLYPEDIAQLYALVRIGTPGELVYRPVKFGHDDGQIYVEVHPDLYKRIHNLEAHAWNEARKLGISARIDAGRLRTAVREQRGIVVNVTRAGTRVAAEVRTPRSGS